LFAHFALPPVLGGFILPARPSASRPCHHPLDSRRQLEPACGPHDLRDLQFVNLADKGCGRAVRIAFGGFFLPRMIRGVQRGQPCSQRGITFAIQPNRELCASGRDGQMPPRIESQRSIGSRLAPLRATRPSDFDIRHTVVQTYDQRTIPFVAGSAGLRRAPASSA